MTITLSILAFAAAVSIVLVGVCAWLAWRDGMDL